MRLRTLEPEEPDTVTRPKVVLAQPSYIVSVDLGQAIDPTAVAVLETTTRQVIWDRWVWASDAERASGTLIEPSKAWVGPIDESGARGLLRGRTPVFVELRHLERLPLRVPYPDQVEHISNLMRRPLLRGASLVVDQTGVGRPIVDLFRRGGLNPTGITITAGRETTRDPAFYRDWHVPKLQLVAKLQAALNMDELHIAATLPETRALVEELDNFRGVFNESGYARFGAREGKHDDLVLAVALGIWLIYSRPEPMRSGTYFI